MLCAFSLLMALEVSAFDAVVFDIVSNSRSFFPAEDCLWSLDAATVSTGAAISGGVIITVFLLTDC